MSETRTRPARLRRKTRRERPAAEPAALSSTRRPDDDGGARRSSAGSPALTGRAPIPSRQALALALLVAISYLPALEAGFVWDDLIFVEEAAVHDWSGLWSIWFSPAEIKKEGHYWPVVYTSFWLDHKLWGLEPLGYHAVNLAVHVRLEQGRHPADSRRANRPFHARAPHRQGDASLTAMVTVAAPISVPPWEAVIVTVSAPSSCRSAVAVSVATGVAVVHASNFSVAGTPV